MSDHVQRRSVPSLPDLEGIKPASSGSRHVSLSDLPPIELDLDVHPPASLSRECVEAPPLPPEVLEGPFASNEVAVLAQYGVAPTNIFLAMAYAYRVYHRKDELERMVRAWRVECARLAESHTEILAGYASRIRRALLTVPSFKPTLDALFSAEQAWAQNDATFARARDAHAGVVRQHDDRVVDVERQLDALRAEAESHEERLELARRALRRAEARVQRIQIEQRNHEQSRGSAPPPSISFEDATAEINACFGAVHHADRELQALRGRQRMLGTERDRHVCARQALDEQFQRSLGATTHALAGAKKSVRDLLASLGEKALAHRCEPSPEADETAGRVRTLNEQLDKENRSLKLCIAARDSYDHDGYRRGIVTASILFSGVALLFFGLLFFRAFG